jgi:hypothetical protein
MTGLRGDHTWIVYGYERCKRPICTWSFNFIFFSFFFELLSLFSPWMPVCISLLLLLVSLQGVQLLRSSKERAREWQGPIKLYPCVLGYTRLFFLYICIHKESTHTHSHTNTFKLLIPICYTDHFIARDCVSRAGIFEKCKRCALKVECVS